MYHPEYHLAGVGQKLNRLRAAVLGANDGIVSIAGLVFGIAGATNSGETIFVVGAAGIVAGALSMAIGEYVSVSSARDAERALLKKERYELETYPEQEFKELIALYEKKGLSQETAETVAKELTAYDAFAAHVEAELKIDPHDLTNPSQAAAASALAFCAGAAIPFFAIMVPPESVRIPVAATAIILALIGTGIVSARMGGAGILRSALRTVLGGTLAMVIMFGIGQLISTVLIMLLA